MEPLPHVRFNQGDFTETRALQELESALASRGLDLVLSDMAPNISDRAVVYQVKFMYQLEMALEFAKEHLKPNGAFVVKILQGEGFDAFVRETRSGFDKALLRIVPALQSCSGS